jgi:pyruvate, orthophosphate dikinase
VSGTLAAAQYARVVNANPLTGIAAVLGELASGRDELDTFGRSPRRHTTVPLDALAPARPRAHARLVALAESYTRPTELLVRLHGDDAELLGEQPLALPAAAALRFFHGLWRDRRIDDERFLHCIPVDAVSPAGTRLDPRRNAHLVPVASGTAVSGRPVKGVLVQDAGTVPDAGAGAGGTGYLMLVDRVEARHTVLLHDPACAGVLALRGSAADHFALLARQRGLPYLVLDGHTADEVGLRGRDGTIAFGTLLTVDLSTGVVYQGDGVLSEELDDPAASAARAVLAAHASPIPLRLNLDTPEDLTELPADVDGIGLLRTEHTLRRGGLEPALRLFLESERDQPRREALAAVTTFLSRRFARCFALAKGRPVTIRLLDFPLHELGGPLATEINPMLGLRGVRQGVRWPELYQAQIEAALEAAILVRRERVPVPTVQLMIPLVSLVEEVRLVRSWIERCRHLRDPDGQLQVQVGAMIETPAAASVADALAGCCDFLSIGSNDLTQLTLGLSREDYLPVLRSYPGSGFPDRDPFASLHPTVLRTIRDAAAMAKRARPSTAVGLCGAHAADPQVLELCRARLVDYLSVPAHQVPYVKLQAIQTLTPSRSAHAHRQGPGDRRGPPR